jgi:hypothetical protein
MTRTIFALLALGLPGCFLPAAPCPTHDAGALSDAFASDAPFVCAFPESCPPGCNATPCGCVSDNPTIDCTP